jgi:pimeloyl-ACP methyl ester carboxylesterase
VLINRAIEALRLVRADGLRRAARGWHRPPLVLVPSILGTRLVDERGRGLWDSTAQLYVGPELRAARGVRVNGLLEGFPVVPGLYAVDVHGAFVRFLESAGGYRRSVDLHVFAYDWRTGVAAAADALAAALPPGPVDLVGVSTGGLIVRTLLARGGVAVRRVVFVGTPQRGSFQALEALVEGIKPAPYGRRFSPRDVAELQTPWDALPHDGRLFLDALGQPLDADLYDAGVWHRYGLTTLDGAATAARLATARRLHAVLAAPLGHDDVFVIGGRHRPTVARAYLDDGRIRLPWCYPARDDPHVGAIFVPGDGSLAESSLRALPGLRPDRTLWVEPKAHHLLPSTPSVHRAVLAALLT